MKENGNFYPKPIFDFLFFWCNSKTNDYRHLLKNIYKIMFLAWCNFQNILTELFIALRNFRCLDFLN